MGDRRWGAGPETRSQQFPVRPKAPGRSPQRPQGGRGLGSHRGEAGPSHGHTRTGERPLPGPPRAARPPWPGQRAASHLRGPCTAPQDSRPQTGEGAGAKGGSPQVPTRGQGSRPEPGSPDPSPCCSREPAADSGSADDLGGDEEQH